MASSRSIRRICYIFAPIVAIAGLVALWQWDWFIPFITARASVAVGREVTIAHLHVSLGRTTRIVADDVRIANPNGFPAGDPFAQVAHVAVDIDVVSSTQQRIFILPLVDLDTPVISASAAPDGQNNYTLHPAGSATGPAPQTTAHAPFIGKLTIEGGQAHVVIPQLSTDAVATITTQDTPPAGDDKTAKAEGTGTPPQPTQIVVDAKGTYAGQPLTAKLVGGALLSLRDASQPYPFDLRVAHGPTTVTLAGTLLDPLAFAGADLKLNLTGPDMAPLYALTGIPLPKTPPYKVAGQLDYAEHKIRFTNLAGTVGTTDLAGTIEIDPGQQRKDVTVDLHSRNVDLEDLGGFIGSEPGRTTDPNMTPQQKQAVAKAEASPQLLPNTKLDLPKLRSADVHVHFRGDHIKGRNVPFDTIEATGDLVDGRITLHPLSLGVGTGRILATVDLVPQANDQIHATASVDVQRLDVARLMAATHTASGAGRLSGQANIDTIGNSLAAMLGAGNGTLNLTMGGGSLNAVLVDLSGLEFGNALLSALGMPDQAELRCLIGQFTLSHGVLSTRTMLIDTSEAVITGQGTIDLAHEQLNYSLKTDAKHLSIGSVPAPIEITGPFKHPRIGPDLLALGARGGAAAGLGLLLPPLALLPTIQLGVGDEERCAGLLRGQK